MKNPLLQFNRGRVDKLALARVDQGRVSISADTYTNFMPRVLGPMSLRPGMEYITNTLDNNQAWYIPFIFSTDDTALIELTANWMRVLIDNVPITRPTVTASITDANFTGSLGVGWIDNDEAGASSTIAGGLLVQSGTGDNFAIVDQQVSIFESGVEHALRVDVERGPVVFMVGSTQGDDDYVTETTLETGKHSLSFTPTGTFHIRFMNANERDSRVESCDIEAAGVIQLVTPWNASQLPNVRWDQSGDVVFIACNSVRQQRIERRAARSWSIVDYKAYDGPFRTENLGPITITPAHLTGNTTLTASKPIFKSTNVGSLYRIESEGQVVLSSDIAAQDTWTDAIKVTGITTNRVFTIQTVDLTGHGSTVTLQRSFEDPSGTPAWADVQTHTTTVVQSYDDGLDNQIIWYRIGIDTGDYGGGGPPDPDVRLWYAAGSITGVVRVTSFSSSTSVGAEIITPLGGVDATKFWSEGEWSARRGYPTAVALHEGRLWWTGKDKIIGSISDSFDSFDPDFEGDAGPINRSIGSGPVDNISWALSLQRLILGGDGAEHSVRSSSFDEPITPTDFMLRAASTQGTANVQAVKVDQEGIFVQRGGTRVYKTSFEGAIDYQADDLTLLVPEMAEPAISRLAVQRKPDTRIHCVRSDGTVMIGVYDRVEDVLAWVDFETDGLVEDVIVLPGSIEDSVYYIVNRTINTVTNRFVEKWATEASCRGGLLNWQADALRTYDGAAVTTVPNLSHLEGEEVVVWADGADVGTEDDYTLTYTVVGGEIVLPVAASKIIVGLPYTAQFKSAKLGSQPSVLNALNTKKRIDRIGLTLAWVHPKGLRMGQDFTNMDDMPEVEGGVTIDEDTIRETYAEDSVLFPGSWESDTRLCLQAQAPRPVTVMAAVPDMDKGS